MILLYIQLESNLRKGESRVRTRVTKYDRLDILVEKKSKLKPTQMHHKATTLFSSLLSTFPIYALCYR